MYWTCETAEMDSPNSSRLCRIICAFTLKKEGPVQAGEVSANAA